MGVLDFAVSYKWECWHCWVWIYGWNVTVLHGECILINMLFTFSCGYSLRTGVVLVVLYILCARIIHSVKGVNLMGFTFTDSVVSSQCELNNILALDMSDSFYHVWSIVINGVCILCQRKTAYTFALLEKKNNVLCYCYLVHHVRPLANMQLSKCGVLISVNIVSCQFNVEPSFS